MGCSKISLIHEDSIVDQTGSHLVRHGNSTSGVVLWCLVPPWQIIVHFGVRDGAIVTCSMISY